MAGSALLRITTGERPTLRQRLRDLWDGRRALTLQAVEGKASGDANGTVSVTEESSLSVAAVWSAVSLISDDIASLPLMLYKRTENGGKDRFERHRLYRLLHDQPNPEMTSMQLRRTMQAHVLTWGNGYAEIERDQSNAPIGIWPITPDRVRVMRDGSGTLKYQVDNGGNQVYLDAGNVVHVPGLGWDGISGYSVVAKARESLTMGVQAERFGSAFFANGSVMGGVISYPTDPPEAVKKNNREALAQRHEGAKNAHRLLAVYGGAKYEQMGIPPTDAQFLETRVFQIREVARWFKIPPHKLADLADATFSNVEQMNLDYYTSCLRPWLEVWEQELERKLIAPLERSQQFIEHVAEGLLRSDAQGRGEFYSKLFSVGGITINEIRSRENLDPLEGGDTSFVPLNMLPLDKIGAYVDAQIVRMKTTPQPVAPKPDEGKSNADEMKALRTRVQSAQRDVLIQAVQCILQREADRARKAQGSIEKLQKWAESFYELHGDYCRRSLLPGVRAWLVLTGDQRALDVVLDEWVGWHITQSRVALGDVLEDAAELPSALERVLHRWETERAAITVDRWIGSAA